MKYKDDKIVYEVGDWIVNTFLNVKVDTHLANILFKISEIKYGKEYWHTDHFDFLTKKWVNSPGYSMTESSLRPATQEEISNALNCSQFKVGDWVYCEKMSEGDFRPKEHIPTFKIEQISLQSDINFLRPIKNESFGIREEHCRLAGADEIKEAQNPSIMIGSHKAKWVNDTLVVGCKQFDKVTVMSLHNLMNAMNIELIQIANHQVSCHQVQQILNQRS